MSKAKTKSHLLIHYFKRMLSTRFSAYAQPRFFCWTCTNHTLLACLLLLQHGQWSTKLFHYCHHWPLLRDRRTPNYPTKTNTLSIAQIDTVYPNPVIVPPALRLKRHRILTSQTVQSNCLATFRNRTNNEALPIPAFAACVVTTRIDWTEKSRI